MANERTPEDRIREFFAKGKDNDSKKERERDARECTTNMRERNRHARKDDVEPADMGSQEYEDWFIRNHGSDGL